MQTKSKPRANQEETKRKPKREETIVGGKLAEIQGMDPKNRGRQLYGGVNKKINNYFAALTIARTCKDFALDLHGLAMDLHWICTDLY